MAYDEALGARIRAAMGGAAGVTEKKMFGGLAFLLDGKMFAGVVGDDLMVRVGRARHDEALGRPHARPMDFTGHPMNGYVYVAPPGFRTAATLRAWLTWGASALAETPAGKAKVTARGGASRPARRARAGTSRARRRARADRSAWSRSG
jgi:hypothetical protein